MAHALPRKDGEEIAVTAHFTVKRVTSGVYTLKDARYRRHCRFGNAAEIRQDIAHALTYDVLPRAKSTWL